MTTLREWINEDPLRRAPEFDFGTQWTREHDPNTEWAVTYNTGTGELYARTRNGDDVEVLGQFADPQDVADAVPDWGRRSMQSGSLDWIRREAFALNAAALEPDHGGKPIYGIVLDTDGHTIPLDQPQTIGDVAQRLATDPDLTLDVARVNTGDRTDRVVMFVDDDGHRKNLPVNATATELYGTGWPILGDAVVVNDDNSPLPEHLTNRLLPDVDLAAGDLAPNRDEALDWDDHLIDRERSDAELGIGVDDDLDLDDVRLDPQLDSDIGIDDDMDIAG